MKKNNRTLTGRVSKVRGYSPIKTDFIDECRTDRRTSGMVREDNRVMLVTSIILIIMFVTFLVIYKMHTDKVAQIQQEMNETLYKIMRYN
jgi:hypothetical protein